MSIKSDEFFAALKEWAVPGFGQFYQIRLECNPGAIQPGYYYYHPDGKFYELDQENFSAQIYAGDSLTLLNSEYDMSAAVENIENGYATLAIIFKKKHASNQKYKTIYPNAINLFEIK